jgi:hypothetical protein
VSYESVTVHAEVDRTMPSQTKYHVLCVRQSWTSIGGQAAKAPALMERACSLKIFPLVLNECRASTRSLRIPAASAPMLCTPLRLLGVLACIYVCYLWPASLPLHGLRFPDSVVY